MRFQSLLKENAEVLDYRIIIEVIKLILHFRIRLSNLLDIVTCTP